MAQQGNADTSKNETPNVKKKHRRMKSSLNRKTDDGDGEFPSIVYWNTGPLFKHYLYFN